MKLENVKCIGILGAGVMGGGIAQSAILAGFNVIVRDLTDEILASPRTPSSTAASASRSGSSAA